MSGAVAIEVKFALRFESGFALDVEFALTSGAVALFGPSGSGKTTVLHVIAGLQRPESGRIRVGDSILFDSSARIDLPPRARRVGLVVQDSLLFPHMDVGENLRYGAPPPGSAQLDPGEIAAMLEIAHLRERMPRNLSGGELKRVALARALLMEPRILLCDEPFAGLDRPRRDRLIEILARVRDELSIPLLIVTHDATEARALAHEVIVMDSGAVQAAGAVIDNLPTVG